MRLYVELEKSEYEALMALAAREKRPTRDQAALLIVEALRQRGYLRDDAMQAQPAIGGVPCVR